MSTLSEHVSLTITQDSVGVARAGFGVPLILSCNATFLERVRYYTTLADVATDGFATTSPEYLAAEAMFAQDPHPTMVGIGRAEGKPTQTYSINVTTVTNSHTYKLTVKGEGVTSTDVVYAADSATTDGEIVLGLVAALNAVVGKNYTASGTVSPITVTATAAGDWFSIESTEVGYLKIEQTHAEPATTLATDLDAIQLESDAWYALVTLYNSDAYVKAAAAWVEASDAPKIYACDLNNSETATLATAGGDTADDLHVSAYARTFTCYHPSPAEMFGAAWLGKVLPLTPGSETWKFKTLAGVDPVPTNGTQRVNLRAKKANTTQTIAGRNITWEGTTLDGNYIDVVRGLDWLEDDMTKSVFEVLAGAAKIPMTNAGIATIESAVKGSLKRAFRAGIIDSDFVVTVPLVSDVSTTNRGLRLLPDVKFTARLQGAIHTVTINGVVSV